MKSLKKYMQKYLKKKKRKKKHVLILREMEIDVIKKFLVNAFAIFFS